MNEQHEHTDEIVGTTEQVVPAESPAEPVVVKSSRVKRSLVTAVAAGVVGLGLGAGAMALAGSHDGGGHDRGDRRSHLVDGNMHFDGQMGPMQGRSGGR
jgi:hypothetical protein